MGRNDEITFERVFGEENIADALEALSRKRDSSGADGVMLSDVGRFWEINGLGIMASVRKGRYEPEMVRLVEIVNDKGKKRPIAIMSSVDRLILRAVTQLLEPAVDKKLTDNCFAFRTGYGTARAVSRAREHIGSGDRWLSQIDVRDYYESIPIKRAEALLETLPCDRIITGLLKSYMRPQVEDSGKIYVKRKGILQGSPLSPMIANLYLAPLDERMEREGMHYCRYADDINVYCRTREEAQEIFGRLRDDLKNEFGLEIKASKSGVFQAMSQQYLGYTFRWNKKEKAVRAVKVKREKPVQYSTWHRDCVEKVDRNYHIVNDGILTKRDYSILFENKKGKKYLPVETVQGIAIYSNVTFASDFFRFMRHRKIGISLFDKYGNFVGEFVSESSRNNGRTMLKQAELYLDDEKRLATASSTGSSTTTGSPSPSAARDHQRIR